MRCVLSHVRALVCASAFACASSPPPRPATDIAVGSSEHNLVQMREWSIELPAEVLSHVRIVWRDPSDSVDFGRSVDSRRSAELSLTGASIGSSVERLADDEASAMQSLEPEIEVQRRRVRVVGVVGIGLTQGDRDVLVAMRNPWRALRLALRGTRAEAWLEGETASLSGMRLNPQHALESASFECDAWAITISRASSTVRRGSTTGSLVESGGWSVQLRVKTTEPEDLDRIRRSFSVH